ncbi:hypothetical protein M1146_01760 [Patescibacteria group bacterium]|nr:hypothetical protein [Patescibacteria group bacterium]
MGSSKNAILKTLLYSDIFDYPLKEFELFRFLIEEKKTEKKTFLANIKGKNANVIFKNGFYCISGRESIIVKRLSREKESLTKLTLAQKIINRISLFPTILFIGVSGALAMKNAEKEDDIDLFVVVRENTVWVSRLFLVLFLKAMGKYRKRGVKNVANKICLNMLLDESQLAIPVLRQNLYSAHEVIQLMPIFDRQGVYKKFLDKNKWVEKFLPNSISAKENQAKKKEEIFNFPAIKLFKLLEPFAKKFQLIVMRKYITIEIVSDNFLAFHPFDYRKYVLGEYEKRLRKYKIV